VQTTKRRNLSQEQISIRILSYLYYKEEGANAHNIQFHGISGRHTQEANRFKKILDEMCDKECIQKVNMSHVTAGRLIYKITDKGRNTIQSLRNPLIKDLLGLTEVEI
jgi:predicted transcriptional regulator